MSCSSASPPRILSIVITRARKGWGYDRLFWERWALDLAHFRDVGALEHVRRCFVVTLILGRYSDRWLDVNDANLVGYIRALGIERRGNQGRRRERRRDGGRWRGGDSHTTAWRGGLSWGEGSPIVSPPTPPSSRPTPYVKAYSKMGGGVVSFHWRGPQKLILFPQSVRV